MSYPQTWIGSTDIDDKSGVGEFTIGGTTYYFCLRSFREFHNISKMLDSAFLDGKEVYMLRVKRVIDRALAEIN